jgi:hypothetical protein
MKSLKIPLVAVAGLFASPVVSDEVNDFAGMDTSSANVFWDVSEHPMLTNEVSSAVIADTETIDTRRVGVDSDAIAAFDSRFRTIEEVGFSGVFRSDKPIGYFVIIR